MDSNTINHARTSSQRNWEHSTKGNFNKLMSPGLDRANIMHLKQSWWHMFMPDRRFTRMISVVFPESDRNPGASSGQTISGYKPSSALMDGLMTLWSRERVKRHGEGSYITLEQETALIGPWRDESHNLLDDNNISSDCVYNSEQIGLYHQKLLNTLYVKK